MTLDGSLSITPPQCITVQYHPPRKLGLGAHLHPGDRILVHDEEEGGEK